MYVVTITIGNTVIVNYDLTWDEAQALVISEEARGASCRVEKQE